MNHLKEAATRLAEYLDYNEAAGEDEILCGDIGSVVRWLDNTSFDGSAEDAETVGDLIVTMFIAAKR